MDNVRLNQLVERAIVSNLLSWLDTQGYYPCLVETDCDADAVRTLDEVMDAITTEGESYWLHFRTKTRKWTRGSHLWVRLVSGNVFCIISDYATNVRKFAEAVKAVEASINAEYCWSIELTGVPAR